MLSRRRNPKWRAAMHANQHGMVLIVALVVLVVMTMAGIALVRSVDTSSLIAGNMAFQQSAIHSGDTGIEDAVKWLGTEGVDLDKDNAEKGYIADALNKDKQFTPAAGQSWDSFWSDSLADNAYKLNEGAADTNTGNKVSYVIHRLCELAGSKNTAKCTISPVVSSNAANEEEANQIQLAAQSVAYYRITVRIDGPRNTVSYVQAVVSM